MMIPTQFMKDGARARSRSNKVQKPLFKEFLQDDL